MNGKRILRVEDVMIADIHSVDPLAPVSEAMAHMRRHGVNALVVNRRDAADEPGLVTVTDIARKVIADNHAPERVNVYEIMSKPVLTAPTDMQARYAVRLLLRFSASRAVVVDRNRTPTGMVTLRDLVLGHAAD